jgi:hypothetical protein
MQSSNKHIRRRDITDLKAVPYLPRCYVGGGLWVLATSLLMPALNVTGSTSPIMEQLHTIGLMLPLIWEAPVSSLAMLFLHRPL